jgi:transcriptional regulator with XRE-family HTH domain
MSLDADDPSMSRVRAWVESHKTTLQELGIKMGFAPAMARQAVYQFLKSKDPRISTLRRFATAAGIAIEELVGASTKSKKRSAAG